MKLYYIWVDKYKQLNDFCLEFKKTDPRLSSVSLKFLIGQNGSGKTSLIEAIGLILTRVLVDDTPGFSFEIIYSIRNKLGEEKFVCIDQKNSRVQILVTDTFEKARIRDGQLLVGGFSDWTEYHPQRIFSLASGPTNSLDQVLIHSPIRAVEAKIYDENKKNEGSPKTEALEHSLRKLNYDPRFMFIDAQASILVLLALCAITPTTDWEKKQYNNTREKLFRVLKGFAPRGISFIINEEELYRLRSGRYSNRYLGLFYDMVESMERTPSNKSGWVGYPVEYFDNAKHPVAHRVLFYSLEEELNQMGFSYFSPELKGTFSPVEFLNTLLMAKQNGLLIEAHLFFKHDRTTHLLDESSLSDGEYLWFTRMGLILLAQEDSMENSLFLFDEPDVFLNESWTSQFVNFIDKITKKKNLNQENSDYFHLSQEFVIATHSTLILTDALPSQLYYLAKEDDGSKQVELNISSFAADRTEVSEHFFVPHGKTGVYSQVKMEYILRNVRDPLVLREIIKQVGPGHVRFRLRDLLTELEGYESESGIYLEGEDDVL